MVTDMKLLLVEDDPSMQVALKRTLQNDGTASWTSGDLQMDAATDALQHSMDERLSASDARMMDFISGIGQVCRQATERGERGSDENPPSAEAPATAQADLPVPEFTQTKTPTGLWRVPLVSSLVLTAAGLLALHYL